MTVWVLGDGLTRRGALADRPEEPVLMIEAGEFARKLPYHPHKLVLVFSAMRHFRDELRESGREVHYRQAETFSDGLDAHFEEHSGDDLHLARPASRRGADRLQEMVTERGGSLTLHPNPGFLATPDQLDAFLGGPPYTHESFYRAMRQETGYLMDGGEPVGGEWNYDEENREPPPAEYDPPDPPAFEPDERTREVIEWVEAEFSGGYAEPPYGGGWADPDPFRWPVTRAEALTALSAFVEERLHAFGPYQDAMVEGERTGHHSLLSAALNLGLLHPDEVTERAIEAYEAGDAPLHSVEGFVRQVIGWREFVRGVYRETEPEIRTANRLDAREDLPDVYWTGETDMACMADCVAGVRERGYSHHIQRLMVLSNFALTYGVEPAQLNRWFHAAYVDAYGWVTTPNVVEMGLYAHGAFATKPYAASANYVDRMSDYCSDCAYDEDATTGEDACPFNALYWEFLDRNEDELRSNHRMGLMYSHLDGKGDEERAAIRERAAEIRKQAREGEL
ncbi:MAG: cryptochrome/photolyase family protein [Halobacteriales archaeon]